MTTIPAAATSIAGGATTCTPHRSLALPARGRAASVASEYAKKYSDAPGMPRSSPTSTTNDEVTPWATMSRPAMHDRNSTGR